MGRRRRYRVVVGFNYHAGDGEVRHEPGEFVEGLPVGVTEVLTAAGAIVVEGEDALDATMAEEKEE